MRKIICGLDEAGRGALAGPLAASAVILPYRYKHISRQVNVPLRDSKLLNSRQREKLYRTLKKSKAVIFTEFISVRRINNHGIGWANKEIFRQLIKKIEADQYIIDGRLKIGRIKDKSAKIRSVVNADATLPPVIFAGIVAKVERDKLMKTLHRQFRRYGWKINKGYGTKKHLLALQKYGMVYLHRSIFVTTALQKIYRTTT